MFHPYKFKSPRILRRADHVSCDTCYVKEIICVDKTGIGSIQGMLAGNCTVNYLQEISTKWELKPVVVSLKQ